MLLRPTRHTASPYKDNQAMDLRILCSYKRTTGVFHGLSRRTPRIGDWTRKRKTYQRKTKQGYSTTVFTFGRSVVYRPPKFSTSSDWRMGQEYLWSRIPHSLCRTSRSLPMPECTSRDHSVRTRQQRGIQAVPLPKILGYFRCSQGSDSTRRDPHW